MEEEFNIATLEHLEEITKLSFSIKQIYNRLIYLEIHRKNISDYEKRKKTLIQKLVTFKTKEEQEYEYFMDDYTTASEALDFLSEQVNDSMSEENKLIFDRINGKLSWIEIFQGINQNPEAIYDEYLYDWERFQILLKNGLSMQEALDFHADYYSVMDDSISFRFVSFIDDEIKQKEREADFIRMKFEESFTCANSLEDYLIRINFGYVKKNLDEEIEPNYPIATSIRKKYVLSQMKDLVIELVNDINNATDNFKLGRLILLFKTYILYFDQKDLKMLIETVNAMIKNQDIAELLIDYINHYTDLKNNQNRDSHGYQFK